MDFPLAKFRILYKKFNQVSDADVLVFAEEASCFVGLYGCKCSENLWMAMTAHMLQLDENSNNGNEGQSGAIASATIDKVSVSFVAPTSNDSWSQWLNITPYGQKFMALAKACFGAGRYVGGNPERDGIKNVYGIRGGRRWSRF